MPAPPRYFTNGPPPKRARRGGRGGRGGRGRGRGGYRGGGVHLTPAEPGFRFFKQSFMENPWKELEKRADRIARSTFHNNPAPQEMQPQVLQDTTAREEAIQEERRTAEDGSRREEAMVQVRDGRDLQADGNHGGCSR